MVGPETNRDKEQNTLSSVVFATLSYQKAIGKLRKKLHQQCDKLLAQTHIRYIYNCFPLFFFLFFLNWSVLWIYPFWQAMTIVTTVSQFPTSFCNYTHHDKSHSICQFKKKFFNSHCAGLNDIFCFSVQCTELWYIQGVRA